MRSNNPVLTRDAVFTGNGARPAAYGGPGFASPDWTAPAPGSSDWAPPAAGGAGLMTVDDVVVKTATLLGLLIAVGAATWVIGDAALPLVPLAAIAGLVLAMVNIFKRQVSPPLVIAYAVCEGVVLGGISRIFEAAYSGIVLQAVMATSAVFAGVLVAYRSGKLRATPKFRKIVVGGLIGLVGLMLLNMLIGMFSGGDALGLNGENFGLSVLVGLGLVVFGALSFVLDFDEVERLARAGVPERESWRASFGLLLGLVFLYLQILRLLAILRGDD